MKKRFMLLLLAAAAMLAACTDSVSPSESSDSPVSAE